MSKTLINVTIPLGFIKAEFFRERAEAVRSAKTCCQPVECLLEHGLRLLRDELGKATTSLEVSEIMSCYGRISLEEWVRSLPDELPNSW